MGLDPSPPPLVVCRFSWVLATQERKKTRNGTAKRCVLIKAPMFICDFENKYPWQSFSRSRLSIQLGDCHPRKKGGKKLAVVILISPICSVCGLAIIQTTPRGIGHAVMVTVTGGGLPRQYRDSDLHCIIEYRDSRSMTSTT